MSQSDLEIDLSEHKEPEEFVQELSKKYPDSNVELSLMDNILHINISPKIHLQERINIVSFLNDRTKEAIHGL
ncbi:MAG: hypothetical protein U9R14_00175 [Patescibacteria group bacterium]|nr:hypothetical protein [Patescibacteria group bacterium]